MATHEVQFPMLVDHGFQVEGYRPKHGTSEIEITNLQRILKLKCETLYDYEEWMKCLNTLKEKAHCFSDDHSTRFGSFAPIRHEQLGYW